jgi:hypothetical protein
VTPARKRLPDGTTPGRPNLWVDRTLAAAEIAERHGRLTWMTVVSARLAEIQVADDQSALEGRLEALQAVLAEWLEDVRSRD